MAGNGIQLGFPFERTTASPLDFFSKVADLTARDAIPSGIRFQGLTTFVMADQKTYQLKTGITNSDWVEYGSGGNSAIYVDTFTATAAQTTFVLTEEPGAKQNILSVQIDGVNQQYASYSLSTKTVTLAAQETGAIIEIRYCKALSLTDAIKLKPPKLTQITYSSHGNSGDFSVGSDTKLLYFEMCGPGAPGTGSARGSANDMGFGGSTGQTSFGASYANGGSRGQARTSPSRPPYGGAGGAGGAFGSEVSTNGRWTADGEPGEHGTDGIYGKGGSGGGNRVFGRAGGAGGASDTVGSAGLNGSGGGGGGSTGESGSQPFCGAGGGGGASRGGWIVNPTTTIAYNLGGAASSGSAGTAGYAGGLGSYGAIRIWEFE